MFSRAIFRFVEKNSAVRNKIQQRLSSHQVTTVKEPHMNDIPVPYEPFESGYARRQVGNNFVLIAGLAFFAGTATFVWQSGVIVPNLTPPKKNLGEF